MTIGLCLLNSIIENGSRRTFRQLSPDLFTEEERPTLDFIRDFYRRHGALPSQQIVRENRLALLAHDGPLGYHLQRVVDRATYNQIVQHQEPLINAVNRTDMVAARDAVHAMSAGVRHFDLTDDVITLEAAAATVLEEYEEAHRSPGIQGITLGWPTFDVLTGGATNGDVITVVARPNVGKSYTLIWQALRAWQAGASVLFCTMEMTVEQIVRRQLGIISQINPDLIRRGQLSSWGIERVREAAEGLQHGAPFTLMRGGFRKTVGDIDNLIQEFGPDLCFIDASYLLKDDAKQREGGARWEKIYEVGEKIKDMALSRNIPIIQSVQFNRNKKRGKENDLDMIGGGDVIAQISSIVLAIDVGPQNREGVQRRYHVLKNREGPLGKFTTNFLFEPIDFNEIIIRGEQEEQPQIDGDPNDAVWSA